MAELCRSGTSHGLTIGAIVGITFGSLVCLALIVVAGAHPLRLN